MKSLGLGSQIPSKKTIHLSRRDGRRLGGFYQKNALFAASKHAHSVMCLDQEKDLFKEIIAL